MRAVRFDSPPQIDGIISEEIWMSAEPVTDFIQREPQNGEPCSEKTAVYIGYDQHNLYIAFRCFGDPGNITAKELARDVSLRYDDRIQIILDTYLDHRNAYWFQVGPRGSIGDAIVSENGAAFNKAWDGLWTGRAKIHSVGWDAELAIPFKTLGFEQGSEQWGLKLIRNYMRNEETGYWPVANLNTHRFQVSDAGILEGLEGISQGLGLDIVPYGLAGADYHLADQTEAVLSAGLEAYYNITSNLKAAVTINTDFAQTEVDDQEINLTRFRLFYPEKRDFFLDGANYFNFGVNGDRDNSWNTKMIPFFSRRIGLDSAGTPIPVQYGSKITGQTGPWNIGAMYMKDQRNGWENSHFAITRISRNFGDQSQAGMISTYGNAQEDVPNLLLGLDLRLGTSKFLGDKNVAFTIYGLKSTTAFEDPQIRTEGRELAYGAEFVYPNDLLYLRLGHLQIQENFVAGIGFVPRPGVHESYGEIKVGPRPGKWGILQIQSGTGLDHIAGFSGTLLSREWDATPLLIKFLSGEEISWKLASSYELLEDPFHIYEDHIIPAGEYGFFYQTLSIHSAQRRKFWGTVDYRLGKFYNGSRNEIKLKAGYKVMVPLFVGGELVRNDIRLSDGEFVANIYRLNLNILFSPDITLYNFVQYDSQSNRMGWQSRFQWILQPGREIFLVWNSIASDPYERFQIEDANARLKVKFTIRF
ncbi:MAG: carbohydrate binding family 9 domain-containing protein [Bacteroidales bacterium]|nr:carbohydrate binding family 9 domain-containing protein [Bacteroidales bacterium]